MAGYVWSIFRSAAYKRSLGVPRCSESVISGTFTKSKFSVRNFKTEAYNEELIERASSVGLIEENVEVKAEAEEEIQKKRNKSRLAQSHRNLLHGNMPYSEPMEWFHNTIKYQRKMYGLYGQSSGGIPGIMWPSKEDLAEMQEYESVAYPYKIEEMIQRVQQKKKEEQEALKAREEDLLKKFAKLEQWKNEVRTSAAKKLAAAEAAKAKKERLVEEVRRHFGYKVDPRDERFKEMLEKKEKEEKKLAKEAKKKARYQQALARLQSNSEIKVEGTETVPAGQPQTITDESTPQKPQ